MYQSPFAANTTPLQLWAVNEMIALMKRIPLLHHSIMMHFEQFKIDNKALIREHLAEEEKEQEES